MTTTLYTTIYDQSPSNSEEWGMTVGGHTLTDTSFGTPLTESIVYKNGDNYPISVSHLATIPNHAPDYDYRAWISDKSSPNWTDGQTVDSGTAFFVVDPSGLMQKNYYGSTTDPTIGKTATLEIPGIDMNIDSDNTQGFSTPSNAASEESIEDNLDAGKVIVADNGDLNGDGIIDSTESATGVAGDQFVPITLSLSANLADAQTSSINLSFSYDKSVFSLWTQDGDQARPAADHISANTSISASSIGLTPGSTVTLYLEALKAYNSTDAKPISVKATVQGSVWSGTLTDEVRAVAVSADSVTATMNGQSQISKDNGLKITNDNVFAIPYSVNQTLDFSVQGFNPATNRTKALLNWTVVRNTQDAVTGALPTLTVDNTDNAKAHLKLDGYGSFNIIAYVDSNGNGQFDAGEQLRVLHLAIVKVTVDPANVIASPGPAQSYTTDLANGKLTFSNVNGITIGITIQSVQLEGGGADKMLGVNKITTGFVQNGLATNVTMGYGPNGADGKASDDLPAGITFPILDTDPAEKTAFYDPLHTLLRSTNLPAGGQSRDFAFDDSPSYQWFQQHTFPGNAAPSNASTVQGTESFSNVFSAMSSDFSNFYVGYYQIKWDLLWNFTFDGTKWVDNGTKATVVSKTSLVDGGSAGVTTGPVWNSTYAVNYH
jgi:hypothetical protein